MFKRRNLWWILAVLCVLSITIVLYINYDKQNNHIIETPVPESTITDAKGRRNRVVPLETSDESTEVLQDESESTPSSNEGVDSVSNEDIYNLDLLASDGIDPLDPTEYDSVSDVIDSTLSEYHINSSDISLAYYNFNSDEHYYINENNMLTAASVTKVPISALYYDLIEKGEYELDSMLPYTDAMYEVGNGHVTNGSTQKSYSVDELITEAIVNSDNTALNVLKAAYNENYGNFRLDTLTFANIDADKDIIETVKSGNIISAYIMEQVFIKIASDDTYEGLIDLMTQSTPDQLFTKYIQSDLMANKFGHYNKAVNDAGIYYENDQPQYALIIFTDNVIDAEEFLEMVSLRVNEWYQFEKVTI